MNRKIGAIIAVIASILLLTGIAITVYSHNSKETVLIEEKLVVTVGEKLSLTTNSKEENLKYDWSSSDENVVIVNEYGEIEAVNEGEAIISVSYNDKKETCKITVKEIDNYIQTQNITLKETKKSLKVGDEFNLEYSIEPKNATNKKVSYYSSNNKVVTVTEGKVVAIGVGESIVSVATIDGNIAFCTITVSANEENNTGNVDTTQVEVESISFNKSDLNMNLGDTYNIGYVITPAIAETTVIWNSSNNKIVSITGDGGLVAKGVGTATITANTLNGKKTSIKVTVIKPEIAVSSVTLNQTTANIVIGDKIELSATVSPSNATDKSITWSSSNNSVASVNNKGVVTASKEGETIITAKTSNGLTAKSTIKVATKKVPIDSISLNPNTATIEVGQQLQLSESYTPSNATNTKITWSSSDKLIATVNNKGVVTGKNKGTVTITAKTDNNKIAKATITVVKSVTSISLNKNIVNLNIGDSYAFKATVLPNDASNKLVTWSSSDASIVSITNEGVVTALRKGTVQITAQSVNGKVASATLNVSEVALNNITLDSKDLTLSIGDTWKVNTILEPSNVTNKTVTWKSGTPSVATVNDDGLITAVSGGVSTITATSSGKSTSIKVTVKNYNLIIDDNNFLKTSGTSIVRSKSNNKLTLRGFNLGVYLSRSLAFMPIQPIASSEEELNSKGYSCINSVSFLQALQNNGNIKARSASTGRSTTLIAQDLSNILYKNYITEEDFDLIAQTGANAIRLPFEYELFLYHNPANGLYSYSSTRAAAAFERLDWVIEQCKKRGIYVILDFHLAPGRQNSGGWCGAHTFFENNNYQNSVKTMWGKIAERYKNEEAVAGYDILNEPETKSVKLISFYDAVYTTIRAVDTNHIIFLEETCVLCGYDGVNNSQSIGSLPNPNTIDVSLGKNHKWENVVYSTHDYFYQTTSTNSQDDKTNTDPNLLLSRMKQKTNRTIEKMKSYNVPYYIGEFSFLGKQVSSSDPAYFKKYLPVWKQAMSYYDAQGLSYTPWTYKGNADRYYGLVYYGNSSGRVNIETATYEEIKSVFEKSSSKSNALRFNTEYYQMFVEQWGGRLGNSISLSSSNVTLNKGQTTTINYTVTPNTTIQKKVVWTSSNPNIARVDANTGKITAISQGNATITATLSPFILVDNSKNVVANCQVTVK